MATINGNNSANILDGTILGDLIKGFGGDDTIDGGSGVDTIFGGTGADNIDGGLGRDFLIVGDGDTAEGEVYNGGGGNNTDTVIISQTAATISGEFSVDFVRSLFVSIEVLQFSSTVEVTANFSGSDFGGFALASNLNVIGSVARDNIVISMSADSTINLSSLTFTSWSLSDTITILGDSASESIVGSSQRDTINAGTGIDSVNAFGGDDVIEVAGTPVGSTFNGGTGFNALSSATALADLRGANLSSFGNITFSSGKPVATQDVFLTASQFGGGGIATDLILVSETTSAHALDITMGEETSFSADAFRFVLAFGSLGDVVRISGDNDGETITGSKLNDEIFSGGGQDFIFSGSGSDRLDGGTGGDVMFGGAGDDIYVVESTEDVAAEILVGTDPGGADKVFSSISHVLSSFIEGLVLTGGNAIDGTGNALSNLVRGNSAANALFGLAGDDRLIGNDGADKLTGGLGADTMTGGSDADRFIYTALADSGQGTSNRDVIEDFTTGSDRVNVRGIDANELLGGGQQFVENANASFDTGEFRFRLVEGGTLIEFNTDGDISPEMQIEILGVTNLTAADLIL